MLPLLIRLILSGISLDELEAMERGSCSELQYAASRGDLEAVDRLSQPGHPLEEVGTAGHCHKRTALMTAVLNGHEAVVKLLLERGADVNFTTVSTMNALRGRTNALCLAVFLGRTAIEKLLRQHQAEDTFDGCVKRATLFGLLATENVAGLAQARATGARLDVKTVAAVLDKHVMDVDPPPIVFEALEHLPKPLPEELREYVVVMKDQASERKKLQLVRRFEALLRR
jgi:hypothetical protein